DPSLLRFRTVVEGALGELQARREEVNDLNVFPVADGDTGDNMALTLRAVLDELDRLSEHGGPLDEIGREQIVDSVARPAPLGAPGLRCCAPGWWPRCGATPRRRSTTIRRPASPIPTTTPRATATARTSRSRARPSTPRPGSAGSRRSATPCSSWATATRS